MQAHFNPLIHVTSADYAGGYAFRVALDDGLTGIVDLAALILSAKNDSIFAQLKDRQVFASGSFDQTAHTIVWPNGADLAPTFLYALVKEGQLVKL